MSDAIEPEHKLSTPSVTTELPPSVDPLAEPLRLLNLTGVLHCAAQLSAPWGLDIPRIEHCMAIHIVNEGSLYLDIAGQQTLRVDSGSLVMIPHGTAHAIRSEPGARLTPLTEVPVQLVTDRYEHMSFGGGGERTSVSYCGVRYDPLGAMRLLQVLPLVIQVDTRNEPDEWLQETARFISREANATKPGSDAIITRLVDIIVVQSIRTWLTSSTGQHGWLAALKDRQIGKALAEIHRDPCFDWSVEVLASKLAMSRSSFSARFSEMVGQSVMQYVTEWRMQLAREELVSLGHTVARVAEKYGYQSESAFSRAFKRVFKVAPGQLRDLEGQV